jgi:PAS domain S-box-containing protein
MGMRIGELAQRTGVGVSTLRAWEGRFRFLEPRRSPAGHRLYEDADVERVNAVHRLVAEGLTLAAAVTRVASVGSAALPAGEAEALLYGQILQAAGQGIWVIHDGRTRYANRRMAELMGYSVEELVALPVLDIFEPADLPLVKERTALARAGKRLHFTQEIRRADGSTFLAEVNTTPLFNQAGRYDGAVALVEDITTRYEAETQAHLRATLLDSIGEAVLATTADGTLVYINAAAERLFGWRAADVTGRGVIDVFSPPEGVEQAIGILSSIQRGKPQSGRFKMARRDGSQFLGHFTAALAQDDDGALVGFVAVINDQTEHDKLGRDLNTRERQAETLALLGAQALRQRMHHDVAATLIVTEAVEATRRLLGADQTTVFDLIAGSNELRSSIASPQIDQPIVAPAGSGSFPGYVALAHRVVVVDETKYDRRFDDCTTSGDAPTASAIGAPIFGPAGIVGILTAESSTPKCFDRDDAHFIQGMANIVGTALLK